MGPFEEAIPWAEQGIWGMERCLKRIWKFSGGQFREYNAEEIPFIFLNLLHKTIKKIGDDIESLKFNTAVSALMIVFNEMEKLEICDRTVLETFLKLLAPCAPFITEEIWREKLGHQSSIHKEPWPQANPTLLGDAVAIVAIQINGKTRGTIEIPTGLTEDKAIEIAKKDKKISKYLEGGEVKKTIFVQNKIINFIV